MWRAVAPLRTQHRVGLSVPLTSSAVRTTSRYASEIGFRLGHRSDDRDVVERVAQANRVAGVLDRRGASLSGLQVDPCVLPGAGHQDQIAIAEPRDTIPVPAVEHVLLAGLRHAVHHELLGQAGDLVIRVHLRPGLAEQPQHLLVMHHDAGVSQDGEAGVLDRLDLLLRQDLQSCDSGHARSLFKRIGPMGRIGPIRA